MAKKVIREVLEKGVERRKSHFRFRYREPYYEDGVRKFHTHFRTFEFLPEEECRAKQLPANHDLWSGNALQDANAYSRRYHQERTNGAALSRARPVVHGSFREWLERFRDEGLIGHAFGKPDERTPFTMEPRSEAGRIHDIGQINTLLRMGGFTVSGDEAVLANPRRRATALKNLPKVSKDITGVLDTQVPALAKAHFKAILAKWAHGKAAPNTKRRLRTTLRSCFQFHGENYGMEASMDWLAVPVLGDGRTAKARALTKDEWSKIDGAMTASKMHPSVEAALRFIRWSGCRRAEAYRLRWEQVNWPKAGLRNVQPSVKFVRTKAKRGNYLAYRRLLPATYMQSQRACHGWQTSMANYPCFPGI